MLQYYVFALFVFVLIILGIVVQKRLLDKSRQPYEDNPAAREARLLTLYNNIEDLMDGFEEYTEEALAQIKEEKDQIKEEKDQILGTTIEIKLLLDALREAGAQVENKINIQATQIPSPTQVMEVPEENSPPPERRPNTKAQMVQELSAEGMDSQDIARELGIGIGEVRLILGIRH